MKIQVLTDAERRHLLYTTLKNFGYEIILKPYFAESIFGSEGWNVWLKAPYKDEVEIASFSNEFTPDEILESAYLEHCVLNNVRIKFVQRWELG